MNIYTDKPMFFGADSKTFKLARRMRKKMTPAECVLWAQLKNREIFKAKFRRQHPAGRYILDFYCHDNKLAIEIDGDIHEDREILEADLNREEELKRFGIKVIRFSNNDVFEDIESVISAIKQKLETNWSP